MKKIISLLMVLCLMASLCCISAFAEEEVPLPTAKIQWFASGGDETYTVEASSDAVTTRPVALNYAVNYSADKSNEHFQAQKDTYGSCPVDFHITVSGATSPTLVYGKDVRLFGYYKLEPYIPENVWVDLAIMEMLGGPALENVELSSQIDEYLGLGGLVQFIDAAEYDGGFSCGVWLSDEFRAANPNLKIGVELVMLVDNEWVVVAEPVVAAPPPTPAPTPVPTPPPVPATADNSNMPLWGILFIGFAAVAVLTAKKKKA